MKSLRKEVITILVLAAFALVGTYVVNAGTLAPVTESPAIASPGAIAENFVDDNCVPCKEKEGLIKTPDGSYLLAATTYPRCAHCNNWCRDWATLGYLTRAACDTSCAANCTAN